MDHEEFLKEFIIQIKMRPGFSENSSHIITHCPNCETRRDKNKHGHCYINKTKKSLSFDCKKCQLSSKKMNSNVMMALGINDPKLLEYANVNFKVDFSHIVNVNERDKKANYKITPPKNRDTEKLKYIFKRLKSQASKDDIHKMRIVLNLSDFIKTNGIDTTKFDEKQLKQIPLLDKYYVGFLSYYGNIINFRYTMEDEKYPRYIKFKVNKDIERSYFYVISSDINPLTDNPVINISESEVDIDKLYSDQSRFDDMNAIYTASSSKAAFRRTLKNALNLTGFYGATINMFLDNDDGVKSFSDYDLSQIVRMLRDFGGSFKVIAHLNIAGKDFTSDEVKMIKHNITSQL